MGGHAQSTYVDPRTWFHIPVDIVDPVAFNVEGWEGLEAPYASGVGRPDGLPGMAGGRDDIQQLVERRTPSVVVNMRFHRADAVEETGSGRRGPWGLCWRVVGPAAGVKGGDIGGCYPEGG
jgi:hypothetical protein